ncbi:MAG: hypothetical protein N2C14_31080, partial [Planctomycetales bacterium]
KLKKTRPDDVNSTPSKRPTVGADSPVRVPAQDKNEILIQRIIREKLTLDQIDEAVEELSKP